MPLIYVYPHSFGQFFLPEREKNYRFQLNYESRRMDGTKSLILFEEIASSFAVIESSAIENLCGAIAGKVLDRMR